ncbi:MAG: proteasome lid subunit RPN8/RPN11, partial [Nitriliruptoraceae bacterium]
GLVIYHSHTHTQAYPSATDIRLAAYPDATYAIVTLQDRDAPDVRAFWIIDGVVTERSVQRTD